MWLLEQNKKYFCVTGAFHGSVPCVICPHGAVQNVIKSSLDFVMCREANSWITCVKMVNVLLAHDLKAEACVSNGFSASDGVRRSGNELKSLHSECLNALSEWLLGGT